MQYTTDICVIHINARSVKNKIDIIEAESEKFDIITLSETWLDVSVENKSISIANFHPPIRRDRLNRKGGGVAIYIKKHLFCRDRPDLFIHGLEAVWVETKLNQESLLIGCFYRSPNTNVDYWNLIKKSIKRVNDTGVKFIILGDFNVDWFICPSPHLTSIAERFCLKQIIEDPTRFAKCLDLIFIQSESLIRNVEVIPQICSDHHIPCVHIRSHVRRGKHWRRTLYQYDQLDQDKFASLLSSVNWESELMDAECINEGASQFTNKLLEVAEKCMPIQTVIPRLTKGMWMNDDIQILIENKTQCYKIAKRTHSDHDWSRYHQAREILTATIRKSKFQYDRDLENSLSNVDNIGKKNWFKMVDNFLYKKGIEEIPPIEYNGYICYTEKEKARAFNDHFISRFKNTSNIPSNRSNRKSSRLSRIIITVTDVVKAIERLRPEEGEGPDLIHNRLLIAASHCISRPLCIFFNYCLSKGAFPDAWKLAHVTPLYQNGPKENCNSYQPVYSLSCVGKLFERCLYPHLRDYLNYNLETSLQSIYNKLSASYDKGESVKAIYVSEMFVKTVLSKLISVGITGVLLKWFYNFLNNRQQITIIKGVESERRVMRTGIPQGSILGPLLFLVYINDVNSTVYIENTSLLMLNSRHWTLEFKRGNNQSLLLSGLMLQANLKWKGHIDYIINKVTMLISCLKTHKYRLSRKALEVIYISYILHYFDNGDTIWNNCSKDLADKLEELHLEAIRTIIGSVRGISHRKLYQESGMRPLKERRRLHGLLLFKKATLDDSIKLPTLVSHVNPYHRRRPTERIIPKFNTELYGRSFIPSTTRLWNQLPPCIQQTNSLCQFEDFLHRNDNAVPSYYYQGERIEQVLHCRLRLGASNLNDDLVNRHLHTDRSCNCGDPCETAEHYLLKCINYTQIRLDTLNTLKVDWLTTPILLFGSSRLTLSENEIIFKIVHKFIRKTERFQKCH